MGEILSICSNNSNSKSSNKRQVVILGTNGAGKTSLVNQLKFKENVITIPTIGSEISKVKVLKRWMTLIDCGGHEKMRPLWRRALIGAKAIIFMIDSSDQFAIQTARNELQKLINKQYLQNLPILLISNKKDLENSKPLQEIIDFFKQENVYSPLWNTVETSMKSGEGIDLVERWLHHHI
jgi:small GTP-binding protein